MSDPDEFTINGETYYWGPKFTSADLGFEPWVPPGLREQWVGDPEPQWEITIGEEKP